MRMKREQQVDWDPTGGRSLEDGIQVWEIMTPWFKLPKGTHHRFTHRKPSSTESSILEILKSHTVTPCLRPLQTRNKNHCQISSTETEGRKRREKLEFPSWQDYPFALRLQGHVLNSPDLSSLIIKVCILLFLPLKLFCSRKRNLLKEKERCQNPILSANFHQALESLANGWFCNSFGFANPPG